MLLHQILTLWCSLADGPSLMPLRSCSRPALPKKPATIQLYMFTVVTAVRLKAAVPVVVYFASRLCYWESHVSSNPWPPATIPACKAATPFQKTQWHSLALHCPEHAKLFNVKLYCWRIAGSQVCANSLRIALLQCCLPTAGPGAENVRGSPSDEDPCISST